MKYRRLLYSLLAIVVIPSVSHAQGFGIAAHAGTLGLGADGAISLSRSVSIRGSVNYFPIDVNLSASDIDFKIDLASPQFLATLDLFPGGGPFRLSAGLLASSDDFVLQGDFTGTVDIGPTTYTSADVGTLTGTMVTKNVSPYVGIGLGNVARRGVGFFLDLGVAFHGSPAFGLEADGPLASDPVFQANLETERRDIEEDLEPFKVYPVLSLGFKIGFSAN